MSYSADPTISYYGANEQAPPPEQQDYTSPFSPGDALRHQAQQQIDAHLAKEADNRQQDVDQPSLDHEPFYPVQAIELPAVGAGEAVVLTFTVPSGYDGAISSIGHVFTGAGFTPSSGDIVWRLRRSGQYFRNFENLTAEFGDIQNPTDIDGVLRIYENELVEYVVEHVAGITLVGDIVCKLRGRIWPRR